MNGAYSDGGEVSHGSVLLRGNFRHPFCSEAHWARSLEALGWQVIRLQEDTSGVVDIVAALERHRPDIFLSVRTWSWPALSMDEWATVERVTEQVDCVMVGLHLDLFWGLDRERLVQTEPFFRAQHLFTADGSHDAEWEAAGVNHHWLPPGVLADECYVAETDPRWQGKLVAFVGTVDGYHSEFSHRQDLVALLQRRYGRRFLRVGNGTPTVRGDELNRLYATVPVVCGDSLALDRERSKYWSDRCPESVGRGGFLLHPRIDALADEFGDRIQYWEWGDWRGLAELIEFWLGRRDEIERRKRENVEWAKTHCTYAHRLAQMLDTLGLPYDSTAVPQPLESTC